MVELSFRKDDWLDPLDRVVVLGKQHLRWVLCSHARYYNEMRTHRSLDKDAPLSRPVRRTRVSRARRRLHCPNLSFRYIQEFHVRSVVMPREPKMFYN